MKLGKEMKLNLNYQIIFIFVFTAGFAVLYPRTGFSMEASTRTKLEKPMNADGNDLDKEITDIKLRASSGAKSKYSASFILNYAGSSLSKPTDDQRPNIGKKPYSEKVNLSGTVGLRYRINKNKSIFLGGGLSQARPFHKPTSEEKLGIETPQLAFNNTFAPIENLQMSSSVRAYLITEDGRRAMGESSMFGYALTAYNRIGESRFDGGMMLTAAASVFDKSMAGQQDYSFGLSPSLQFNKGGWYNFYTSVQLFNYFHMRSEPDFKFTKGLMTQSLGAGIAVRRDIYLSPYVTFEPENIAAKKTSVNLSTTINL